MGELFQGSTSQLSFERFINTINQDQAKDLVRNINQFMKKFRQRSPDNDTDSREVQEFLTSMEQAFARHPLWSGSTREELDNAIEGLEKYLMTKLYDRTFGLDPLDRERDAVLSRRLAALVKFVTPAHLEVSEQLQGPLASGDVGQVAAAAKELKKMSLYKSPRDKLVQVLNCSKITNDFLTSRRAGAGADDFTPALIYVTIKAQPEALASNLSFIERYRYMNRLNGEAAYFFVQMQGAVAFLETLSPNSLASCDPEEFIYHMLATGAMSEAELTAEQIAVQRQRAAAAAASAGIPPPPPPPDIGNPMLSPRGHAMVVQQQQQQQQQQQLQGMVLGGNVYGSRSGGGGVPLPPPPPPPPPLSLQPSVQPPQYYISTDAYGRPLPYYYTQYGMAPAGIPYVQQQWGTAPAPGSVPFVLSSPPPPPPPPTQPPPPPPTQPPTQQHQLKQASQFVPLPPKSVPELEQDGIRLVIKAESAGELRAKYPYLYCTKESLTLKDVSQLLVSYKELVLRYETLAQAVENNVVKYFSDLEAYQAGLRPEPPGTTSSVAQLTVRQQLPSSPLPHHHHKQQQQEKQYNDSDLISLRNAPTPPPPPPPPPPQAPTQAPTRGPLDLSQYMPSYQLETEGWPYQTQMVATTSAVENRAAPGNASGGSASTAGVGIHDVKASTQQAPSAAAASSTAATADFFDLPSDDGTVLPPLSPSPHLQRPSQQQQQEQRQQEPSPSTSCGGSGDGDGDGDEKKLTSLGSGGGSTTAADIPTVAEAPSTRTADGIVVAADVPLVAQDDHEPSVSAAAASTMAAAVAAPLSLEATLSPRLLLQSLVATGNTDTSTAPSSISLLGLLPPLPPPPAHGACSFTTEPSMRLDEQSSGTLASMLPLDFLAPSAEADTPSPLTPTTAAATTTATASSSVPEMPPVASAPYLGSAVTSTATVAEVGGPGDVDIGGSSSGGVTVEETEEGRRARVDALLQQLLGAEGLENGTPEFGGGAAGKAELQDASLSAELDSASHAAAAVAAAAVDAALASYGGGAVDPAAQAEMNQSYIADVVAVSTKSAVEAAALLPAVTLTQTSTGTGFKAETGNGLGKQESAAELEADTVSLFSGLALQPPPS